MIEAVIAVCIVCGGIAGYVCDRRSWNGGVCRDTGEPWVYFDTDSQGGRGYKSGENCTWISWPGIDRSSSTRTA